MEYITDPAIKVIHSNPFLYNRAAVHDYCPTDCRRLKSRAKMVSARTRTRQAESPVSDPDDEISYHEREEIEEESAGERRRSGQTSILTIPVLLNEAQKSLGHGQIRYAKMMWDRIEASVEDELHQLCICLKWMVSLSERNMYHDRLVKFFGILASLAGGDNNEIRVQCLEVMVQFLVEWSRAKEPLMRWRVCQLIGNVLNNMPEDADSFMGDAVLDEVQDSMVRAALEDGKPNVRAAAVRALLRFPQPDDESGDFEQCEVVACLLEVLRTDKSKEVRKSVISVLPLTAFTLPSVILRTRDEADDVRKTAFLTLAEKTTIADVQTLNLGRSVSELIREGLTDRVESVVEATQVLITSWFDSCGGEPLTLLKAILSAESISTTDIEAAELGLMALFDCERLDAVQVAMLAASESLGLRTDFRSAETPKLMSPEEALFWRVVCVHLSSEASSHGLKAAQSGGAVAQVEAATAGERLEAFEAVMPSCLDDLAYIIDLHSSEIGACSQLLLLAAQCADFTDASGRRSVGDVTCDVLTTRAYDESLFDACFAVIRKVYSGDEEMNDSAFKTVHQVLENAGLLPFDGQNVHSLATDDLVNLLSLVAGYLASMRTLPDEITYMDLSWSIIIQNLVLPSTTSGNATVRALAYKCQGLFCLIETGIDSCSFLLKDMYHYLISSDIFSSQNDDMKVKATMIQALGDSCLLRGPKTVQLMVQELADESEDEIPTFIDILIHYANEWIEADNPELFADCGDALVETLIKLVAVNEFRVIADQSKHVQTALEDGDVVRILVKLFVLCFDPCTLVSPKARQSMLVFFQRFATMSMTSQQYLATAMLPSARTAAALDVACNRKTLASGAIAPKVIKFATQLLQMHLVDRNGEKELFGHEPLAEIIMGEIIQCINSRRVSKQYLNAMCKVPAALPMHDTNEDTREVIQKIHVYASHALGLAADNAYAKDLENIQKVYSKHAKDGPGHNDLVQTLLDELRSNLETFCEGYPEPFSKEDDVTYESEMSDSDQEESSGSQGQSKAEPKRRLPARSNRTAANMNEISDDEEEQRSRQPTIKEEQEEEEEEQENIAAKATQSRKTRRRQSSESVRALGEALNRAKIVE